MLKPIGSPPGTTLSARGSQLRRAVLRRSIDMARRAWRAYWSWRYRKAMLRLLQSMNARMLRDIGIDPPTLHSILRDGEAASWDRRAGPSSWKVDRADQEVGRGAKNGRYAWLPIWFYPTRLQLMERIYVKYARR